MANLPTRNQNPGDLKDPTTGDFRQFSSPQEGHAALLNDLTAKITGTSTTGLNGNSSLVDFSKVYAPASDNNDPARYAANLANRLGVSPDTKIGALSGRIGEFADAISGNEGYKPSNGYNPKPFSQPTPGNEIFSLNTSGAQPSATQTRDGSLGSELQGRLSDAGTALTQAAQGKINPLSGVLQAVGAGAGAIGDVTNKALELIPGVSQLEGLLGKGVSAAANTGIGKAITGGWNSFAQAHPEAAADIGALGNVATVIPIFKGFGVLKEAAGATLAKALGKDALSSVIEDVAPKETAGSLAKGIAKRGTVKSLISGRISAVTDPAVRDLAETVVDNVPGFANAKTLAEKIRLTQDTVSTMADDLKNQVEKAGANRIYSYRELNSYLNRLPRPTLLVGDMEKVYQKVIDKALEISRGQGGTISSLFDSRKLFDDFVSREFPNLYSSDSLTPMRTAIKNIRQGMNQFIEDRLPSGSGFRKSLRLQNKLLNAVDNMSKKAASGYTKEIGTTRLQRFGQRHPVTSGLIRHTAKTALEGAGLAGGYGLYKNITGQ